MIREQFFKGSENMLVRNNLTEEEVKERLTDCFTESKIEDFIVSTKAFKSYNHKDFVLLYFKQDKTFSIVSTGVLYDLVK